MVMSSQISIPYGKISVLDTGGEGVPVILIHGAGMCKELFEPFFNHMDKDRRLIAIDLPGHGASSNAYDPAIGYTIEGYRDAVLEVLTAMDISSAILVGWSLGGHVSLHVLDAWDGVAGVVVIGAGPVSEMPDGFRQAYQAHPASDLLRQADLSSMQKLFLLETLFQRPPDLAKAALNRADPESRPALFAGLARGETTSELQILDRIRVPVTFINGAQEPLANLDYVDKIAGERPEFVSAFRIHNAAHAPFLENDSAFAGCFQRSIEIMTQMAKLVRSKHGECCDLCGGSGVLTALQLGVSGGMDANGDDAVVPCIVCDSTAGQISSGGATISSRSHNSNALPLPDTDEEARVLLRTVARS